VHVSGCAILKFGGNIFNASPWAIGEWVDGAAWWNRLWIDILGKYKYDVDPSLFENLSYTSNVNDAGSYMGDYRVTFNAGAGFFIRCFMYGRIFDFYYPVGPSFGSVKVVVDGVLLDTIDQYADQFLAGQTAQFILSVKNLHDVRFEYDSGQFALDAVEVTE
jgi:hypothetical protein